MANVINRIVLTTNTNGVSPTGFNNADAPTMIRKVSSLLGRAEQGACSANMKLSFAPVAATSTVTFTGNTSNADTLTVGNLAITFVTSGAVASSRQINLGTAANGTDVAASVAALINGTANTRGFTGTSTAFNGIVTATVALGVVTISAYLPGTMGNGLAIAKSSSDISAATAFSGGSEGTFRSYSLGL